MEKELKCPNCGSINIETDDDFDNGYDFLDGKHIYFELNRGECKNCGTFLQWREIYPFAGYDRIIEN